MLKNFITKSIIAFCENRNGGFKNYLSNKNISQKLYNIFIKLVMILQQIFLFVLQCL